MYPRWDPPACQCSIVAGLLVYEARAAGEVINGVWTNVSDALSTTFVEGQCVTSIGFLAARAAVAVGSGLRGAGFVIEILAA